MHHKRHRHKSVLPLIRAIIVGARAGRALTLELTATIYFTHRALVNPRRAPATIWSARKLDERRLNELLSAALFIKQAASIHRLFSSKNANSRAGTTPGR
jgi:hypothetical protein